MDSAPDIPGFRPDRCALYLQGTEGAPPRAQLLAAIGEVLAARCDGLPPPCALDVGCGPGREVLALLEAGFAVDGFDPYPEMLERSRSLVESAGHAAALRDGRVRLWRGALEDQAPGLPMARYDLVHAGFVLPFVRPHAFERCWMALAASLRRGGVFAGQFFGPNDEFVRSASAGDMTSHVVADLDRLFAGWTTLQREEVDRPGAIGRGVEKRWHVHHVVALRP